MSDIQGIVDYVDSMMAKWAAERSEYHLTLGQLIAALKACPRGTCVKFDHNGGAPGTFDSYRGYYSDLAIDSGNKPKTAAKLLSHAMRANGKAFHGYKGGDYVMTANTPLWNAPYGVCGRAIVGTRYSATDKVLTLITEDAE